MRADLHVSIGKYSLIVKSGLINFKFNAEVPVDSSSFPENCSNDFFENSSITNRDRGDPSFLESSGQLLSRSVSGLTIFQLRSIALPGR